MASNESAFRKELLDDAKKFGSHAKGNVAEHDIGRPDVFIKATYYPTVWIELKYSTSKGKKINLSEKQRKWGRTHMAHGGTWAWAVCVRTGPLEWQLFAGTNPNATHVSDGIFIHTRKRGEKWDVETLLNIICNQ